MLFHIFFCSPGNRTFVNLPVNRRHSKHSSLGSKDDTMQMAVVTLFSIVATGSAILVSQWEPALQVESGPGLFHIEQLACLHNTSERVKHVFTVK